MKYLDYGAHIINDIVEFFKFYIIIFLNKCTITFYIFNKMQNSNIFIFKL